MSFFAILPEHERAVVFTLGRASGVKGPGLVLLVPGVQTMKRVDTRGATVQLRNVSVRYRVADPLLAIGAVADYHEAMKTFTETVFTRVMSGRGDDALVFERAGIAEAVRAALAPASQWGLAIEEVSVNR